MVKSTYLLLRSLSQPHLSKPPSELYAHRNQWKNWAPSKVCAFSWQLLLDRLPTKFNLHRREMTPKCVLCGNSSEKVLHLFLHCDFVSAIWYEVSVVLVWFKLFLRIWLPLSLFKSRKAKVKELTTVWWQFGMQHCGLCGGLKMIESLTALEFQRKKWSRKLRSCLAYVHWQTASNPCRFYEWFWNPLMCMVSTCFLSLQFMLIGPFGGGFLWRISGFKEALYAIFMIFCCSFGQVFYSGLKFVFVSTVGQFLGYVLAIPPNSQTEPMLAELGFQAFVSVFLFWSCKVETIISLL